VPGETIVVEEGQVHCFVNLGKDAYDFSFACPKSHLIDNSEEKHEGDRCFTNELEKNLPESVSLKN